MTALLIRFFAPWAKLYQDVTVLATGITFLHVAGLLWGGGRAVTADTIALRTRSFEQARDTGRLALISSSHRDVLIGLAITALTGGLMFAADVKHYLFSAVYWSKMVVIGVMLINGAFIKRLEAPIALGGEGAARGWARTRRFAAVSLALWFIATLLGQALVDV
jgi:hypothetical protein